MKVILILITLIALTSCQTLVKYEGVWISEKEHARILELQHKIFDLGVYDNDESVAVVDPNGGY